MNEHTEIPNKLDRLKIIISLLEKYQKGIEEALEYSHGVWTFDHVCAGVLNGSLDLYAVDGGVIICQLLNQSGVRIYNVLVATGDLKGVLDFAKDGLEKEARLRQCTALSFEGRDGWKKVLEALGWSNPAITMYKRID